MSCVLSAWAEPLRGSWSTRDPGFMNPTPGIIIYIFTTERSLWSGVGIEILTNVYTYDNNHSHVIAGVSQRVNK